MSKIVVLLILCLSITVTAQNRFRTDFISDVEVINVASKSDVTMGNPRAVQADVGGIIKVLIEKDNKKSRDTVVMSLPDQVWTPVGNIIKVFSLYNGSDSTTCQVYDSTGTLVRGIKVGQ